jgi:aminoglycoside phosphotransferase (APT) family kinase protein
VSGLQRSTTLATCRDEGLVREALDAAREWLSVDDPAHDRVIDEVNALGDGNLANVLWHGGRCRLLDFEEFGVSDLAYEVGDVVEHASSRLRGHLDVGLLIGALDLDLDQLARVAAYRQLLATFWLIMLLPGNGGFGRNPPGSTENQARHVLALLAG